MTFNHISRNDIHLQEQIGSGGFGVVYKALLKSKNATIACKCIDTNAAGNKDILSQVISFTQEMTAYIKCQGPYIISTYGYSTEQLSSTTVRMIILMEYMPKGSLTNLLQKENHQLTFRKKIIIACHIASGLVRIHQHGIIHRDLRPDNILIDSSYRAKISDMGISQSMRHVSSNSNNLVGCIPYMPPEFYQHTFTDKLDIYTLGLTLNHLFTGAMHSFNSYNRTISLTQISPIFSNLIYSCMNINYNNRPTSQTVLSVLQTYRTHLEQKLQYNHQYQYLSKQQKDAVCLSIYGERNFDTTTFNTGF